MGGKGQERGERGQGRAEERRGREGEGKGGGGEMGPHFLGQVYVPAVCYRPKM